MLTLLKRNLVEKYKRGEISLFRGRTSELSHFYESDLEHNGLKCTAVPNKHIKATKHTILTILKYTAVAYYQFVKNE